MTRWTMALALAVLACSGDNNDTDTTTSGDSGTPAARDYSVQVRTTSYGIPHVLADDHFSAGVGVGWALARDHMCTFADQIVKIRGERSRYHGPGADDRNVNRDFAWLNLGPRALAEQEIDGLESHLRDAMAGFAEGYNRYLADTPEANIDPRCRGEAWLVPISEVDLFGYYLSLGQRASGNVLIDQVGEARPPRTGARGAVVDQITPPPLEVLEPFKDLPIGSNGWAIGRDRTESKGGMLLSNTHFPSEGQLMWWENHVTIPGVMNVYGASLLGSVIPNLGFNEHVAWTHTVSNTPRFVVYQLSLDPKDPTRYLYDGDYVDMESNRFTIQVKQKDGSLASRSRTMYRSQWGPMFNAPLIGWSPSNAFTWRDVNVPNTNLLATFYGMGTASNLEEFKSAHRDYQGIPWVHTMYTDDTGNAFYVDSAATPNLSPAAVKAYEGFLERNTLARQFAAAGVWVVDGKDPVYDWVDDARAVLPGSVPFDDAPQLLRSDFVNNANQNYWMSNPLSPLEGYAPIYGPTGQPLSPRTKMNNRFLLEENGASGKDHRFTLEELEAAALSFRASIAEDLLASVVKRCTGVTDVSVPGRGTVDISEACGILGKWDGRSNVDAVGAHIWREFVLNDTISGSDVTNQGRHYADDFDPKDPIYTPSSLAEPEKGGADPVLENLGHAVLNLAEAGVALDARLGDIQVHVRNGTPYSRPGGQYLEGLIGISTWGGAPDSVVPFDDAPPTVNSQSDLQKGGYQINNGNSWVMAMEHTGEGPRARAILVYSQSSNLESPHYADQSALYETETLRPVLYTEADILADPELETVTLSSSD